MVSASGDEREAVLAGQVAAASVRVAAVEKELVEAGAALKHAKEQCAQAEAERDRAVGKMELCEEEAKKEAAEVRSREWQVTRLEHTVANLRAEMKALSEASGSEREVVLAAAVCCSAPVSNGTSSCRNITAS